MFRDCAPAQLSLLAGLYNCLFCFIACEPTLKISVDNVWKRCLSHEFQMSCHVSWQWHDCLDRFLSSLDDWTTSTECWWSVCRRKQMSSINFTACGLPTYVCCFITWVILMAWLGRPFKRTARLLLSHHLATVFGFWVSIWLT